MRCGPEFLQQARCLRASWVLAVGCSVGMPSALAAICFLAHFSPTVSRPTAGGGQPLSGMRQIREISYLMTNPSANISPRPAARVCSGGVFLYLITWSADTSPKAMSGRIIVSGDNAAATTAHNIRHHTILSLGRCRRVPDNCSVTCVGLILYNLLRP